MRIPEPPFVRSLMPILALTWTAVACFPQEPPPAKTSSAATDPSLKKFLQSYVRERDLPAPRDTRYVRAFFDLNLDGKEEAIVFLVGPDWCGTGGCPTLILTSRGASWRILAHILATHTPIRVLAQKSNGWHNLSAMVKTYHTRVREEAIRFNGKTYRLDPKNPVPVRENTPGDVVIPSLEGASYLFR